MTALFLVAVFLLVLVNGFFVASEFALVRTRRPRMEALAEEGKAGAALTLRILEEISKYLSSCQFGITLASLAIGFLGEPAIAKLVEPALGGVFSHGLAVVLALVFAYTFSTALHITIGEQVPKIWAIVGAEEMARRIARPLHWFTVLFQPAIVALNGASNGILRLGGIKADEATAEEGGSPEELKLLIAESLSGGQLDAGEAGMLTGVFHLHEQEARQVMTPFPAVVTVDTSEDVETALRRCVSSGHTRLVVTEDENPDRVKGIVHVNSLVQQLMAQGPEASLEPFVRDAPIVPETKPLDDLLADLQRERAALAVVVDEYGRTAGVVAVEDIVEEVVGEIEDETDPAGGAVRRLANGDWFVRGHVAVDDLVAYGLELAAESDAYNSVGGFVFAHLGRLPRRGDTVRADGYSIRVESVRENRVEAVRIRPSHVRS
ncbi:MAG: hemolysin family protein [Solirubrobacteraceae bacterium]